MIRSNQQQTSSDYSPLVMRRINWETILFVLILILTVFSRFYILGERVMSHDENSHVYFSWLLEQGRGYKHDPVTHGPLQFHLIALSYFLLGDNDFTARIPAALLSVATVGFMWFYRRILGKAGAMIAAVLFLISPYILYYGRYARNESLVGLFGVIMLWAILKYLDSGEPRYMYWLTIATVLHFTAKETSFIYTAQALVFLALYLVQRLIQNNWPDDNYRRPFLYTIIGSLILISGAGLAFTFTHKIAGPEGTETVTPLVPGQNLPPTTPGAVEWLPMVLLITGLAILIIAVYFAVRGYTWQGFRSERSFGLLVVLSSMVFPMLSPFPVRFLGSNPIDYQNNVTITLVVVFIIVFALLAVLLGLAWNPRLWLVNAAIFYSIFTVFYTTMFTYGFGFITGLVGSLGYWLEQQGVNRGSQPWYYYAFIQIPIYEYLPALGSFLAIAIGFRRNNKEANNQDVEAISTSGAQSLPDGNLKKNALVLFTFWSITSLLAFTFAGEKMPWLTFHITLPMILLCAWGLGKLVDSLDWAGFIENRGWVVALILPVFFISALAALGSFLGTNLPFQGKELNQLQATTTFITAVLTSVISAWGIFRLSRGWQAGQLGRMIFLMAFALMGLLTGRAAVMASFINYDDATEYLVYAHSARGPKEALEQIEEISRRTTDGLAIKVAYDNETTYPFWWYLRNYSNQVYYEQNPTRDLRDAPVILVGDNNYGKIEPVVGQAYNQFDYIRLWWPNQDYFGLTWERIVSAIKDPRMRQALFNIWLNRDYDLYGELTSKDISLINWYPSARMRLYIRKDVVSTLWNYGTVITQEEIVADPYEGKEINILADQIIGQPGTEPGQFQKPHDLAVASDGSIYVVDTDNNRIQHLDSEGKVLEVWGSFGDITTGSAPEGTFNQPWGIGLGPDDSVYVADTWNHRVQKFTGDGEFVKMWGYFGQAEAPDAFWGPRDIAVSSEGKVFVTDTGNKRIVVFDADGNYITQFGEAGMTPGQFDEPVGIAISSDGKVYIADTWNQRVQVMTPSTDETYTPSLNWEIVAWYGQSLDNKPFIAVDDSGNVFITDPEGYRVLQFDSDGKFVQYWGTYSTEKDGFGMPASIAIDSKGGLWVSDAGNSRLMHFTLSKQPSE